jgi:rubrerythrin
MDMGTQAALEALDQAIELEMKGQAFYLEAAKRTVDPKGVKMFQSLAEDEVFHQNILRRQVASLTEEKGWVLPTGANEVEADLQTPLFFPADLFPTGKEIDGVVGPGTTEMDALLFAIKIENDSFNLYLNLAKAAEDPNAKRMYEYLVDAERTHFDLLMLNYESIASMGGWVD